MYKIYVNEIEIDGVCDWEMAKALTPMLWDGENEITIVDNDTGVIVFGLINDGNVWEVYYDEPTGEAEIYLDYGVLIITC